MSERTIAAQPKAPSHLGASRHSLLQRQCACGTHSTSGAECAACGQKRLSLQRKLMIGASNDPLELEADRIADQVMAAPVNPVVNGNPLRIQRFSGHSAGQIDAAPASVEHALASPGRPLEPALMQDMQQHFGHDFSRVRVHTDAVAEQSARDVNAHAYTVGHSIAFEAGQFAPHTTTGRWLLAHELTHVLQQKGTADYPAHMLGQQGAPAVLQREPDESGSAAASLKKGQYPPWARSTPVDALPGDPVPGYETPRPSYSPDDADKMSVLVHAREKENKANVGAFIGDFGEALTDLWGKQVTEAMKQAAEDAGWSFFKKLLKFVVIKGVEWTLAAGLTPAGAAFFEALEVKVSESVLEKATEAGFAYYMETAAERREEAAKGSKLEETKKDLDLITERFATLMKTLPRDVITSLPDVSPWLEWLRNAQLYQLAKFRLPPLFPVVKASEIRATVAGLIAGELHGILKIRSGGIHIGLQSPVPDPRDPTRVDYYDDDIIVVRNMNQAQIYSPSPEIVKAIAGQVPISKIPLVPLYVYGGDDVAAAKRLMTAFRGFEGVSEKENEDFLKAYGASGNVVVTRNPAGKIEVSGRGLAGNLKLYMAGTGDSNLVKLSSDVLIWAQGESEYRREIGKVPDEGVSRLVDAADLAVKTRSYLEQEDKQRVAWAKVLITNEIEKLVPQKPVDRWSFRGPTVGPTR